MPQLPGLLSAVPPRRAARGREDDALVIYLTLAGNTPFSKADYNQVITQMAQRFYEVPGSLTTAMTTTAEVLNQYLVERNLRRTEPNKYLIGRLILGVLRGGQFIFAQCGPTRVYHLTGSDVHQIHDAQISGRGLGFGQATPIYLSQVDLHAGDRLVLCARIPTGWEGNLGTAQGEISPDALRQKWIASATDDLYAALVQVQDGSGNISILRPSQPGELRAPETALKIPVDRQPAPDSPSNIQPVPPKETLASTSVQPGSIMPGPFVRPLRRRQGEPRPGMVPVPDAATDKFPPQVRPNRFVTPRNLTDIPEYSRSNARRNQKLFLWLGRALQGLRLSFQRMSHGFKTVLPRLLPDLEENPSSISTSSKVFIIIAIPVILVTIASMVYMRYGKRSQYEENYQQAVNAAVGAVGQGDSAIVRHAWESTIYYLDLAESYKVTEESQDLRNMAELALDTLDGIIRLNFQPAIYSGLDQSVQISQMAATNTDLYLLDSTYGNVLHYVLTHQSYEKDTDFLCEPGIYNEIQIGALIDLTTLTDNSRDAALLAMDANGNLLYCAPGVDPEAVSLTPPELGWHKITGFSINPNGLELYVLDAAGNGLWIYPGQRNDFLMPPTFFFGNQVPQNMDKVIDMATNGDDLFLLFEDGHVTTCLLNSLEVVRTPCTDPTPFEDSRPGHQAGPTVTDAVFSQIIFADAPDRFMYLLEPLTQSVYRANPRPDTLNLQGQFRAPMSQSKIFTAPAAAMAISPNRYLFLSIGNQVYFATDVP